MLYSANVNSATGSIEFCWTTTGSPASRASLAHAKPCSSSPTATCSGRPLRRIISVSRRCCSSAVVELGEHVGEPEELLRRRHMARQGAAVLGAILEVLVGREAEGAGRHRLA